MSIFLVLDILLVLLIVLFMPIGFWRGPIKELFVTLGIFFGVMLADYWASPWGSDLADMSSLTSGAGAFVVAMAFLVATTFILGYGLGATLAPAMHTTLTRVLGAAVAAFNGALLLSFSLQYIRLYLLSDANEQSLYDSYVARFLLNDLGWLLMIVAIAALPILLYILVSGYRAYEPAGLYDDYAYDDYAVDEPMYDERTRPVRREQTYPPRVPVSAAGGETKGYKAERPERRKPANAETRPLVVSEPQTTAEPSPSDDLADRMGDTDPHMVLPRIEEASDEPERESESEDQAPTGSSNGDELPEGYGRCVNCHAVLAPDVTICPNCGTVRESSNG
jgi:uncharacterized membrane protein required for colicin V production